MRHPRLSHIAGGLVALLFAQSAVASYHYSGNRCDHSLRNYKGPGVCGGRGLPQDRARDARNIRLECSSASDHHMRGPVQMSQETFDRWAELEDISRNSKDPGRRRNALKEMHELRTSEPKIEWSGVIPYKTVEAWSWTSCEMGQSSYHCGSHTDIETYTVTVTDADGNTSIETRTRLVSHANHCEYDHDRSEAIYCSNEVMDFHSEFEKPGSDWRPPMTDKDLLEEGKKPAHLRYSALIPNKYDLLPGELEDVQVSTGSGQSTTIRPFVTVGDAWNHYKHSVKFKHNGSSTAECKFGERYAADFVIHTEGRDNTRKTPNAFRIPTDGEAFGFFQGASDEGEVVKTRPSFLHLEDSSNGVLELLSHQVNSTSEAIERAKAEAGLGKTGTLEDKELAKAQGAFKNTTLRIILMEKNTAFGKDALARDRRKTKNYKGSGALLTLDGDIWKIPLNESYSDLYQGSGNGFLDGLANKIDVQLMPGTEYLFLVSMYQENIPFYAQASDQGLWSSWWQGEDAYFSRPLELLFHSPKGFDNRSLLNRLADY